MDDEKVRKAVDAVRAMSASGMTLAEIRSSLKSMNISDSVTDQLVAKARVGPTSQEIHEAISSLHTKLESGEHLKPIAEALQRQAASSEEVSIKVSDMQSAAEEHARKLSDVNSRMSEHSEAVRNLHGTTKKLLERHEELRKSFSDLHDVGEELENVKSMLMDMRPTLNALRDLNAKILETNREILLRMKK